MQRNIIVQLLAIILSFTAGLLSIGQATDYPHSNVDALIAGYGRDQQGLISKTPPAITIARLDKVLNMLHSMQTSNNRINDFIVQALTTKTPGDMSASSSLDESETSSNAEILRLSLCVPGSDLLDGKANDSIKKYIKTQCQTGSNIYNAASTQKLIDDNLYAKNAAFDANTLIEKSVYDKVQSVAPTIDPSNPSSFFSASTFVNPAALDYILYIAGTALPLELPTFISDPKYNTEKLSDGDTALSETSAQKYLVSLRSYVSQLSAGLSSLYSIYNDHLPSMQIDDNDDTKIAIQRGLKYITSGGKKWTSKFALEEYMSTWRIKDHGPNTGSSNHSSDIVNNLWRDTIKTGTPVNLQRELAYINAEELSELYQLRRSIESLTMTMTSMQLSMLRQQRNNLNWGQSQQVNG